jgi:hypothetical protein
MDNRLQTDERLQSDKRLQVGVAAPSKQPGGNVDHVHRGKRIGNPTIARLLRSARRIVEEMAWEEGLVWHPEEILRRVSPRGLADRVLPERGTPGGRACARAIRRYTGKPLTEKEARHWLAKTIGERLYGDVIGARSKIDEVRLVVTEKKIEVRAERPDTTLRGVGTAPFRYD